MQPTDDGTLLRQYSENHSDEAFAALVTRHINLVYSVALRQVGDPHQAEEITQAIFILLAKKAAQLRHDKALSSWLFQATRLTANNFVRGETRRHRREQEAHMQSALNESGGDVWPRIAPLLDAAVAGLNEQDRHAIVLRFYEGRNLREVGAALGASEDAAEKRVNRAVEKLRTFFAKRGVTIGASGLVVVISANAVQAAPVGLAVTISTATALAGTTFATTAAVSVTKAIAMTTLQKAIVTATVAVLAGAGIYEVRQASQLRDQVQTLRQQQARLAGQIEQLQQEHADATNRLTALLAENRQLKSKPDAIELIKLRGQLTQLSTANAQRENDPVHTEAKAWLERVTLLKERLEQMPDKKIPEMQFLSDQDWLRVTETGGFETDADVRRAWYHLREDAKNSFARMIGKALGGYVAAKAGLLPADISELIPYFESPVDTAMLERYRMLKTGDARNLGQNEMVVMEKAPVDDEFDTLFQIGLNGRRSEGVGKISGTTSMGSWSSNWNYSPRRDQSVRE